MGIVQDQGQQDHPLKPTNHKLLCQLHYMANLMAPPGKKLPPHVHMCVSPRPRRESIDQSCRSTSGMKPLKKQSIQL